MIPNKGLYCNNDAAFVPWAELSQDPVEWLRNWDNNISVNEPSHMKLADAQALYNLLVKRQKNRSRVIDFKKALPKDIRVNWGTKKRRGQKAKRSKEDSDSDSDMGTDSEPEMKKKQKGKSKEVDNNGSPNKERKVTAKVKALVVHKVGEHVQGEEVVADGLGRISKRAGDTRALAKR
jgi:hypothetical protein